MKLTVRIPSDERVTWSEEAAKTAIGKPLLDHPTDGARVGEIVAATVSDAGDLVLAVEVFQANVEYDLAAEEILCAALMRPPFGIG